MSEFLVKRDGITLEIFENFGGVWEHAEDLTVEYGTTEDETLLSAGYELSGEWNEEEAYAIYV